MREFDDPEVAEVFGSYPPRFRKKLLALRELIFETARATEGVGELEETLKWGEPAYLTSETGSGTTIRIAWKPAKPEQYALYVHCQTDLIERFREWLPKLRFEANRAIVFREDDDVPEDAISLCIASALTYHADKKKS